MKGGKKNNAGVEHGKKNESPGPMVNANKKWKRDKRRFLSSAWEKGENQSFQFPQKKGKGSSLKKKGGGGGFPPGNSGDGERKGKRPVSRNLQKGKEKKTRCLSPGKRKKNVQGG